MFEGVVAGILNRFLGKYVQDLDTENLNVGIFSGNVNLTDLKLKPEALYELDLPIDVKIGTVGRVNLKIPWTSLYSQPLIVNIEDVLILVGPAISNTNFDPEREKRLLRAAKRKILQDLESESEVLTGPKNFFEHLFTAIVNNVQIFVRNVHIRYEDSISSKNGPLACGFCLQSLSILTTNNKWKPSVTPVNSSTVYQMMRVESLSLYWNPEATVLDDAETAHITPMQYYNWKHYMVTGLDKFSMHYEGFEFLLQPVTCKVKVILSRSGEARVPRLLLDAVLQDSALQLSRRQYLSIANLATSFERMSLNRKYRHLHPGVPLANNMPKWWKYAYNVVVEQRVRPFTWQSIKKHRENYHAYMRSYKNVLRSPNDTELKMDLQMCEDNLPIISVVIAREQAKFELLSQEPDRIEVVESEFDWWKPTSSDESDTDSESPEVNTKVELCVKTERSRTLWSHLSSPEKKKVCELIGYAEGAPRQDKPKQYIEHKLNLTLANCTISIMNRSKEVVVMTLTQFLVSLETRPTAKAYKLSARAENILVEGLCLGKELVPILTGERAATTTTPNILALDFEKNPLNSEADYGICCTVEPLEFIYNENACNEIINFFQTRSMTTEKLIESWSHSLERAGVVSKSMLAYAVSRKKTFHVSVDVKGPCVIIPEYGYFEKEGFLVVLDVSRIIIKSDLQPSTLVLEDATCMELEERLYDRLHAECSCQVLFCSAKDLWRESRRHADSDHHLVPKVKMQVVFSNSIKKDYKLLPRYKLNMSMTSLKLNLSDGKIDRLLEFCKYFPFPASNTLPVSFLDSGGSVDEESRETNPCFKLDKICPDPGYTELIRLRQKIVHAYLNRNRLEESKFDKSSARLGFQECDKIFVSSEHSDEDMEVFARNVELPGFDDNVSPSNNINTLLRFLIGEIVVNLCRTTSRTDHPYIMLSVTKVCLDVALMAYGPALQLSVQGVLLTDKERHSSTGHYLEVLASDPKDEVLNLLYRKVRADCPEFRSHFHSVERALVADTGALTALLHSDALRAAATYLQRVYDMISTSHVITLGSLVIPKSRSLWNSLMNPDMDPPVPPGATKFSYSVRASQLTMRLLHQESSLVELRLCGLESDCVFRANDRMILKLFLNTVHVDDLSEMTLYPKLVWLDEDKVLEVKYVRHAPRMYSREGLHDAGVTADGALKLFLGRLHVVLLYKIIADLHQFLEPLLPPRLSSAAATCSRDVSLQAAQMCTSRARLNLAVNIHAPALLLPQKPSSPNLLILNMGDLSIENFFKETSSKQEEAGSPAQHPVIDNVLIKLVNITLSRAVMTLAGTLEVQEPILDPVCIRCDVKRLVGYPQPRVRELLQYDAALLVEAVSVNLGQKDLATILAVWSDNFSEGHYIGGISPCLPIEVAQTDNSVKKLQQFFAQGDPVKKEAMLRCSLEGVELKLFSDVDEVLSSPVRDLNRGLAKLSAGEATVHVDRFTDGTLEVKASLQSLLVEDIRPDPSIVIKRIFQSHGGSTRASCGISVCRPPLLDVSYRHTAADCALDVRVEQTRLNLAVPFLLQLGRTLLEAMPGSRVLSGGVVNHGYVGDAPGKQTSSPGPAAARTRTDSSSGYSTAPLTTEDVPGLSISIQFRKPEIMFFTDLTKTEGHALLLRTELLIDYSHHSNTETLVVSLAGLQIMSKLQSKLNNLPPQLVLHPCDVEYSRTFKNVEEGVRVKVSVSNIDVHLAATTVHTITDIIDDIATELSTPEEKEPFNFATYNPKAERGDEDLWTAKKVTPSVDVLNPEDSYPQPRYPGSKPVETFTMTLQNINVLFEIERKVRVPVVMMKMTSDVSIHDWSKQLYGRADLSLIASYYNEKLDVWEPLLEPLVHKENTYMPWEVSVKLFQSKAYPLSSKLEMNHTQSETDTTPATSDAKPRPKSRKTGFESETSAEEGDTDTEMTFIRNPNAADKHMSVDMNSTNHLFLSPFGGDDSDSENENGLMDKLASAISHLFTDESSADEYSNDDDTSGAEQSETEGNTSGEKAVSFIDGGKPEKKERNVKSVTLQDPVREDSIDSGLETESYLDKLSTYVVLEARDLNITVTPQATSVLHDLMDAFTNKGDPGAHYIIPESDLSLVNDIGPGSTVHLVTRAETDLAGNDRILAIADYDMDNSRPSTPGCDTSIAGLLDDVKHETDDVENDWDCFEGGFSSVALHSAIDGASMLQRLTDQRLVIKMQDFEQLTVVCPQRTVHKLHLLHPTRNNTRYYLVLQTSSRYNKRKIIIRSPLQIRNETSYALELFYKKTDLQAVGVDLLGELTNPFDDKMRLAIIPPDDTYNVPLYIAYHCKLFLLPSNFESYQTATQGLWWAALGSELGTARDVHCPAKASDDDNIFAMRILTQEECHTNKVTRAIPNYLIRVLPPLAFYNRLPYAIEISIKSLNYHIRIEAGERTYTYIVNLLKSHKIAVDLNYLDLSWSGHFTLSPDVTEKNINMATDSEMDGGNKQLGVCVKVVRNESWEVYLHAPYWIINKTGLPLQLKGSRSDVVYSVTEEPLLWSGGRGCAGRWHRLRVRAHHSDWSRGFSACVGAPGLVVCSHRERATSYRLLLTVTLSELCPQLTKVVTLLPYFLILNDTKRHLRFMEENEAADLWFDLAPAQCTPFWPQTDSMMLHCKFRDSPLVSQHFPITKNLFTVLRMDKGSAMSVHVTGGIDSPFTVTFKPYSVGDAPVRVDNLCENLHIKLHQKDSGQVSLLSPSQSMLYTWDDPATDRTLMWNIYNNKGNGFVADFSQDAFGEEKFCIRYVNHSTLEPQHSVTSKLSSTFKRLTPKSPERCSSSSDDSDNQKAQDSHSKSKKLKKDKTVIYWVSFVEGYQRVYALIQDERLAHQYRSRINSEKSNYEVYLSLSSVSLSVCVQTLVGIKELSYISLSDSLPRWEVNVSHKWKLLSPDLASWIEEKYLTDQKKCQLKEYIHIDLEKMQMTKPFFSELRRTYNPGIWVQLRKSATNTYLHMKVQRFQIDNQLNEAIFPTVLHPAPLPSTLSRTNRVLKPCLELVILKQHRPSTNQDVYKYFKVLVQEYCVNLDRGFVNYVFDILNHWRIEEKPAVRLRADLALIHMPLKSIAMNSQAGSQRSVLFEYVHLSPITLVLSLSSRGYLVEEIDNPNKSKFDNKKENRPKLFNSDLLEYLFNSWGSSLCDMKDVKLRMSYLELTNASVTMQSLTDVASRHYWTQLVQQFYVLVLGLKILGNPYSVLSDFSRELKHFYEPFKGNISGHKTDEVAGRLRRGISALLGHCASASEGIFSDDTRLCKTSNTLHLQPAVDGNDLPEIIIEASKTNPASVALALSGLVARPAYDVSRATQLTEDVERAVRAGVERSGGRLVARWRLPRHCRAPEGLRPYSPHCALGLQLLRSIARGHYADTDVYLAHCSTVHYTLLLTTQHIFMVRASGSSGAWHVEWLVQLDDLIGVPVIDGDKLVLNIKQNELVSYFSTDEKIIEFSDQSALKWMQMKIECALILNLEDKPCPPQM